MKIKICGVTTAADAELALAEGADFIGIVFGRGPRSVEAAVARDIVHSTGDAAKTIGVFCDMPLEQARILIAETGLSTAQLNGSESSDYSAALGVPVLKGFASFTQASLEMLQRYDCWAYLLDVPRGGVSRTQVDPHWAVCAKRYGKIFVGGRLAPDNVHEVVRKIRPFGVDVSAGVEATLGRKDPGRVRAFIQAARSAHAETQKIRVAVRPPVPTV